MTHNLWPTLCCTTAFPPIDCGKGRPDVSRQPSGSMHIGCGFRCSRIHAILCAKTTLIFVHQAGAALGNPLCQPSRQPRTGKKIEGGTVSVQCSSGQRACGETPMCMAS